MTMVRVNLAILSSLVLLGVVSYQPVGALVSQRPPIGTARGLQTKAFLFVAPPVSSGASSGRSNANTAALYGYTPRHASRALATRQYMSRFPDNTKAPDPLQPPAEEEPPAQSPSSFPNNNDADMSRQRRIRKRVTQLARRVVFKPISYAAPMPQAVAAVLKDATMTCVDMAVEEVTNRRNNFYETFETPSGVSQVSGLIDEAFLPLEQSLEEMEVSLTKARASLNNAKLQASEAMEVVQAAAIAQTAGAATAVAAAESAASEKAMVGIYEYAAANDVNITGLNFEDVDYATSEMAPPFLGEDSCLVPGEPVIRVEKAPENSRRIFAGIDIMASVDDVWKVMTDYAHLQDVVPNLVVNEVLALYNPSTTDGELYLDSSLPEDSQCKQLAEQMKGSLLKQVGGAKVAGINFSARTTLEVREWPQGLPDFDHFRDEVWDGKSRKERATDYAKVKLQRYCFPRPFAVSSLPTRDISMQSIEKDDGEFRMYQGVWRMQPLPGCAPEGKFAMRLTYAVEVSPRAYLPVQLIERRIAADLCSNLVAIRSILDQSIATEQETASSSTV